MISNALILSKLASRFASLWPHVLDRGLHFGVPIDRQARRREAYRVCLQNLRTVPCKLQGFWWIFCFNQTCSLLFDAGYLKFNDAQNTVRLTLQETFGLTGDSQNSVRRQLKATFAGCFWEGSKRGCFSLRSRRHEPESLGGAPGPRRIAIPTIQDVRRGMRILV